MFMIFAHPLTMTREGKRARLAVHVSVHPSQDLSTHDMTWLVAPWPGEPPCPLSCLPLESRGERGGGPDQPANSLEYRRPERS